MTEKAQLRGIEIAQVGGLNGRGRLLCFLPCFSRRVEVGRPLEAREDRLGKAGQGREAEIPERVLGPVVTGAWGTLSLAIDPPMIRLLRRTETIARATATP